MKEFNGYNFESIKTRKKMKYLIVEKGDLDLNGCYAFGDLKDLKGYLKWGREVMAIFKVKDITSKYLTSKL